MKGYLWRAAFLLPRLCDVPAACVLNVRNVAASKSNCCCQYLL